MPNFQHAGMTGLDNMTLKEREAFPDIDPDDTIIWYPVWRPELIEMMKMLPNIQPSVLYIVGSASGASRPDLREARLTITGTGQGGSGGHRLGRVKQAVVEGGKHFLAMDKRLAEVVQEAGSWLGAETKEWREREDNFQCVWKARSPEERRNADPVLLASCAEWTPGQEFLPIVKSNL